MAEKRMFAKRILESDAFLDMPLSSQALYFHLNMSADDDGFVNNPRKIQRMIGASDDDFKILVAKQYVITFENGIMVIKHWRAHNYIQKDRYKPTDYEAELELLEVGRNKSYELNVSGLDTDCVQVGYADKISIDKSRVDKKRIKESVEKNKFSPPTLNDVSEYCTSRSNNVDAQAFIDFYESKGWMIGKNKMKDWKAAVRTWERKSNPRQQEKQPQSIADMWKGVI